MAENKAKNALVPKVEEMALNKIREYQEAGMILPAGFNPANSLKKARFMLNDMKVNGVPVLECCSQTSILQCLLDSCAKGLDFSELQVYFIPRAGQMTIMESVYGRIVRAKRASKNYKPIVQYVHEGDVFEFGPDLATGRTVVKKHETCLENLDKPYVAAYTYVTDNDGDTEVFIMTKKDWVTSWKKSSNGGAVAKEFERDMIFRTIIKKATKSLVNSNSNNFVPTMDEDDDAPLAGNTAPEVDEQPYNEPTDFVEAEEEAEEVLHVTTIKVKDPSKYEDKVKIIKAVGEGFVEIVEQGREHTAEAKSAVERVVEPLIAAGADKIVLGCTHYPFLRAAIERVVADRDVEIIDSGSAVSRRVAQLLDQHNLRADSSAVAEYRFITLGDENYLKKLQRRAYGCCSKEKA